MSSTAIMRALLVSRGEITALVPAARIIAGIVQQGTVLPAIGISEISNTEDITTARRLSKTMIRSRVQVTVYASSYRQMKDILLACKLGAGVHSGTVGQWRVNSVLQWGVGPEIPPSDDKIYEQSRDFMVTFMEAN
jgi:hypothetical protein